MLLCKKSKNIACDVTVRTMNFKWHMPIREEICRAEQKYMPFFGTVAERVFWKKNPKHRNIYKSSQCCALDFFSRKTRSVMVPRFGFFPGFTDKGYSNPVTGLLQIKLFENNLFGIILSIDEVARLPKLIS